MAIMPATRDCTCLGHLGQNDRDRDVSIFCRVTHGVAVADVTALNFANGNTALINSIFIKEYNILHPILTNVL